VQMEGFLLIEKSSDVIENRTHNLLACSIVPQPTVLLHAPTLSVLYISTVRAISCCVVVFGDPLFCRLLRFANIEY
jgi:hypothetical protein